MSHTAALYEQQAHSCDRIRGSRRAQSNLFDRLNFGGNRPWPLASHTPWHWILQGSVAQRSLVSRNVRARWRMRNARGLVRSATPARRLQTDGLPRLWAEDEGGPGTSVRFGTRIVRKTGTARVPSNSLTYFEPRLNSTKEGAPLRAATK